MQEIQSVETNQTARISLHQDIYVKEQTSETNKPGCVTCDAPSIALPDVPAAVLTGVPSAAVRGYLEMARVTRKRKNASRAKKVKIATRRPSRPGSRQLCCTAHDRERVAYHRRSVRTLRRTPMEARRNRGMAARAGDDRGASLPFRIRLIPHCNKRMAAMHRCRLRMLPGHTTCPA